MVEQFLNHLRQHQLCKTTDKILLAVSGGIDSMVMLDLFRRGGYVVGVAHCNYQLRGGESDGDEKLVAATCRRLRIPLHVKRFDTHAAAAAASESLQITARRLRYDFFHETARLEGYNAVATAHNLNDNLETVVLNLIRGTGIEGIAGIPVRNGMIIRPMLSFSRETIREYATTNGIEYREDSSNEKDDYSRNFVRHHIIPRFRELNPNVDETFRATSERLVAGVGMARASLAQIRSALCSENAGRLTIDLSKLRSEEHAAVILWEILKESGFHYDQCIDIMGDHQSGKVFVGQNKTLTIDRGQLIVTGKTVENPEMVLIESDHPYARNGQAEIQISRVSGEGYTLQRDASVAQLDADQVRFPLLWRPWRSGDSFTPLGMEGKRNVSDLLTDLKFPLPDKKQVTVLESAGEIVWVTGVRISDRYKVTPATRTVLLMELRQ